MPEPFFHIPKDIVRCEGSLASGGNNAGEELTLVDLGSKPFVLQAASVTILEDNPQENLLVRLVVRAPNPSAPPGPPVIIHTLDVPMFQTGDQKANGSGNFVGAVRGPIPIKAGETLGFQVQRKVGPGTYAFHAKAWGFSPGQ